VADEQRPDDEAKCGASKIHCVSLRVDCACKYLHSRQSGLGNADRVVYRGRRAPAQACPDRNVSFHFGGGPGSVRAFLRGRRPSSCSAR
jgi:hypothetical protein